MTAPPPEVRVHLHHAMTGTYPLRLLDLLFCPDRALAVEYDYLTGLALVSGRAADRAAAFAATVREEGVSAALDAAERTREFPYDALETVRVYDGGWLGREKVVLDAAGERPLPVRVHGPVDVDGLTDGLEQTLASWDVAVERRGGLGLETPARLPWR